MAQQHSRETLYQRFRDKDFQDLVASSLNVLSDRIAVDDNGLKLEPRGDSNRLVSFFENIENKVPVWNIAFEDNTKRGAENAHKGLTIYGLGKPVLFLQNEGNVGIKTKTPQFALDVNGVASMHGRVGNFKSGKVPADGDWHNILEDLEGCQAFEAMAHIIDDRSERYALTHATLLISDKDGEKCRIISTNAGSKWLWGKWLNKIQLRWKKAQVIMGEGVEATRYTLQMRSRSRYGLPNAEPHHVFFRLLKLWDKHFENEDQPYQEPIMEQTPIRDVRTQLKEHTPMQKSTVPTIPTRRNPSPTRRERMPPVTAPPISGSIKRRIKTKRKDNG